MKEKEAELFAFKAHASIDQKRKYTNDPYIIHPINVAYLVRIVGGSEDMICAAYLHDILEDVYPLNKYFNEEIIKEKFGENVLNLVKWLTDKSRKEDGNREIRKKIDRENISKAPMQAKTIKLADLIDNSITITKYDPNFSKIYLKEKRLILPFLIEGDNNLYKIANNILIRNGY
jgi:(p)ppGpp synthase/HD superfamily hydrolase